MKFNLQVSIEIPVGYLVAAGIMIVRIAAILLPMN